MKVLVIGTGAREHALVLALTADPQVTAVHAAPGNPGIEALAQCHPVQAADPAQVARLAADLAVDLVVVGPEVPLVAGVADAVRAAGVACFGPSAAAARLEGSKAFAKDVMAAAGVPTGASRLCRSVDDVAAALAQFGPPHVVKDDGLAAGKGVLVTADRDAALEHARGCLQRADGAVVVEEYLDGPEVSLFCLTDGTTVVPLAPAQDFKRALDGDQGPNTGGMGAYSPLPWAPPGLVEEVVDRVARPTIEELARRGTPFVGTLYCGLALTSRGLRVIEFNCRFGDPETQVVLPRLHTPLGGLLWAGATGRLGEVAALEWRDDAAVVVVLAGKGYPDRPRTGDPIMLAQPATLLAGGQLAGGADTLTRSWVLHAGTAIDAEGRLVSAGGRVLSVVGTGADLAAARSAAYALTERIELRGGQYRRDIAAAAAQPVAASAT